MWPSQVTAGLKTTNVPNQRHINIKFYESCCKKTVGDPRSSQTEQRAAPPYDIPSFPSSDEHLQPWVEHQQQPAVPAVRAATDSTLCGESHVLKRPDVSNLLGRGGWRWCMVAGGWWPWGHCTHQLPNLNCLVMATFIPFFYITN